MTDQICRELELAAPLDVAWAALTDPAWLERWLADEVELDLVPGGEARFAVDGETRSGWVEEVRAPCPDCDGRLVFWWREGEQPATRVAFELEATDAGTRLWVVESRPLEALHLVGAPVRELGGGGPVGPALIAA